MKKNLLTIVLVLSTIILNAQTINVHFNNGTSVQFPSSNVDYVDFSTKPADPVLTSGKAVDLGLSVYWASCNLGAESPEEYGDYYSWGETSPKTAYSESTYSYYDNNTKQYKDIGSEISGTQYDAAKVNLGGSWRMPTEKEFQELLDNCTWEWVQKNNVNGYEVTGKNGNSIFLPAGGWISENLNVAKNEKEAYWTSTKLNNSDAYEFLILDNESLPKEITAYYKFIGNNIRPVTTDINDSGDTIDHSQDYLVTDNISLRYTGGASTMINGMYQRGSQFSFTFSNNSNSSVTLTGIYMKEASETSNGNNSLGEYTEVDAGESKSYTITLGRSMSNPQAVFTYMYNKKTYKVTANVQ